MSWGFTECAAALLLTPYALAVAIGLPMQSRPRCSLLLRMSLLVLCFGGYLLTIGFLANVATSNELFLL